MSHPAYGQLVQDHNGACEVGGYFVGMRMLSEGHVRGVTDTPRLPGFGPARLMKHASNLRVLSPQHLKT